MFSKICSNRDPVSDLVEFLRLSSFLCKNGGGEIDTFSILMGIIGVAFYTFIMRGGKWGVYWRAWGSKQFMWGHVYGFLCGEILGRAGIDQ